MLKGKYLGSESPVLCVAHIESFPVWFRMDELARLIAAPACKGHGL